MSLLTLCNRRNSETLIVDVERNTVTAQTGGGRANSWASVYSDQPCCIQPSAARVVEDYMRRELRVSHTAYFPALLNLKEGDRINDGTVIYTYRGGGDMAGRALYTIAHCERIGQ